MRYLVRTCPGREMMAQYVIQRVPEVEVIFDHQASAILSAVRALARVGDDPAVFMEDDIVLTEDFTTKAEAVIAEHGDVLIQFFSMRKKDLTVGSRREPASSYMMDQCFYAPAGMARDLVKYYPVWPEKGKHRSGFDLFKRDFMKERKLSYWLHVPSLVQHRIAKSAIDPRRSSKRQSQTFAP